METTQGLPDDESKARTTSHMPGGEPGSGAGATADMPAGEPAGAVPPPAPPAERPRLVRTIHNRQIAGVAAGLGAHFNIDPVVIRVAFVVLAFAGGVGIPLYFAGWLLIPKEGERQSLGEALVDWARQSPLWMVVLLLVAGTLVIGSFNPWNDWAALWAVLLIAAGIFLYRWDTEGRRPGQPPATGGYALDDVRPGAAGATVSSATETPQPSTGRWQGAQTVPVGTSPGPAAARRPRSYLGRYTFAVILIVLGLLAILDNTSTLEVKPGQYPAIALALVGIGLLTGALWGRSRGLILAGFALLPFAYVGGMIDVPLGGGVGQRFYAPGSVVELRDQYRLFAGEMTLDLTRMEWGSNPVEVDTSVAFGEILVLVPEDVNVDFRGHANAGEVHMFDQSREGLDVDLRSARRADEGEPLLILEASASFGTIQVTKGRPEAPDPPLPPQAPDPPSPPDPIGV
ncbi:MAG TPA: PspC domain-containing protein [Actinomycetota bacterium]|nr:PspC domain-containing protein [Actinomycetota bacterium]